MAIKQEQPKQSTALKHQNGISYSNGQKEKVPTSSNGTTTTTPTTTPPTTSATSAGLHCTHSYIITWCFHMLVPIMEGGAGNGGLDLRPVISWDYTLFIPLIVVLLGLYASRSTGTVPPDIKTNSSKDQSFRLLQLAVLAHMVDMAIRVNRMPAVWDHEFWGLLCQSSFILTYIPLCFGRSSDCVWTTAESVFLFTSRVQLVILYTAAAFWKLNTSFFDIETSCGTVLILELVTTYVPWELPETIIKSIAQLAPLITVLGEAAIAFFMLLGCNPERSKTGKLYRNVAVLMGAGFHTTIFMMPVNAAGGFSLDCVSRYILFFDSVEITAFMKKMRTVTHLQLASATAALTIPVLFVHLRHTMADTKGDVGFVVNMLFTVLYGLLAVFSVTPAKEQKHILSKWGLVTTIATGITLVYSLVIPILGLQQMSAPTMYANVRYYGPSNHYLVPIGLLGDDILFGGGLVHVLKSTSPTLNMKMAYIKSDDVFSSRVLNAIDTARNVSHNEIPTQFFPMCMYNPHSRDMLMDDYLKSNPLDEGGVFFPFILPVSTVREALQDAIQAGETFTVTLGDAGRSENFVSTDVTLSSGKRFVIDNELSCKVEINGIITTEACIQNKIGKLLLESPKKDLLSWIVAKLLVPYPKIIGMGEEVCMS